MTETTTNIGKLGMIVPWGSIIPMAFGMFLLGATMLLSTSIIMLIYAYYSTKVLNELDRRLEVAITDFEEANKEEIETLKKERDIITAVIKLKQIEETLDRINEQDKNDKKRTNNLAKKSKNRKR